MHPQSLPAHENSTQVRRPSASFRELSGVEPFEPAPVSSKPPASRLTSDGSIVASGDWIPKIRDQAARPPLNSEEGYRAELRARTIEQEYPQMMRFGGGLDWNGGDSPIFQILPTAELANHLEAHQRLKTSPLSIDEILTIATNSGRPFRADAVNELNAAYYNSSTAFSDDNGLATFFVGSDEVNAAFAKCIIALIPRDHIRIKELSTGSRSRWASFAKAIEEEAGCLQLEVELTDHTIDTLPADSALPESERLQFSKGIYSLFDDFEYLEPADRFDVLLSTYGFDTVWLPGDHHYCKHNGNWYQAVYRIGVPDWHPSFERAQQFLAGESPLVSAGLSDLHHLGLEVAWRKVDLSSDPNSKYLVARDKNSKGVNVPAGLVSRVEQAFQTQLREDGVFIIGEVASYHPTYSEAAESGIGQSGRVARFKIDDLWYAQLMLEEKGFHVHATSADSFIHRWTGVGDGLYDIDDPMIDQCVLIVSRKPLSEEPYSMHTAD